MLNILFKFSFEGTKASEMHGRARSGAQSSPQSPRFLRRPRSFLYTSEIRVRSDFIYVAN